MSSNIAALLLLADGRLPAGGYAHSGGLEESVRSNRVTDAASLEHFLAGRAATTGLVAASFAAAACHASAAGHAERLRQLDAELDARILAPALRSASRALGRQLLRTMASIHPHPELEHLRDDPHQPVVFGVAAAAFDLGPRDAAAAVLHDAVAAPAAAVVKVVSMDPFTVHAALARLTSELDRLADAAAAHASAPAEELPSLGAPLLDIAGERHRSRETRLFAS